MNTKIVILTTYTTSVCPPLNEGITRLWKVQYRSKWLTYMCDEYDASGDPMKSINVLQAIRWGIAAWEYDVTSATIESGWIKSGVLESEHYLQTEWWSNRLDDDNRILRDIVIQKERQIKLLMQQKCIKSAMKKATFVDPVDEALADDNGLSEEYLMLLAEAYSARRLERDHEADEEDDPVYPIEQTR